MDHIWTPWRYHYVKSAGKRPDCVFCEIAAHPEDDESNFVVHRAEFNFVVLNRFPYTSGHVMVIPYEHWGRLEEATPAAATEMMSLTQTLEGVLRKLYKPDGLNIGMNIGKAAGAGVAGHIHMHCLPRWIADNNFSGVIGETRVLPEELAVTWSRIRGAFEAQNGT